MTVHRRRGAGYAHYWALFAFAAFGLGALLVLLATGSASVQLTPWKPAVGLLYVGVIAGVLRWRSARR